VPDRLRAAWRSQAAAMWRDGVDATIRKYE
jgi:hypothetical protein